MSDPLELWGNSLALHRGRGRHHLGAIVAVLLSAGCGDDAAKSVSSKYGSVSLELSRMSSGVELSATGTFANGSLPERKCASEKLGTCELLTCTPLEMPDDAARLDPGKVEITGAGETLELTKALFGGYGATTSNPSVPPAAHWQGGESLTLRVSGSAEFPALSATLVAPLEVTLDPRPEELGADPGADVRVNWSTPREGSVTVAMASFNGGADPLIICEFPAETGSGTLPAQLITQLNWSTAHLIDASTSSVAVTTHSGASLKFSAWHYDLR